MPRRRRPPRSGALGELPPLRILGQIAAVQGLYYATALVLMLFSALVAGTGFSLDLVLGWSAVRGDTTQGWLSAFLWILDGGLFMAVAIFLIVVRTKLVLDFALTLHLIHLVVVSLYTGLIPRHVMWWATMALSSGTCIALATWGCRYRELRPISFGGIGGGSSSAANGDASGHDEGGEGGTGEDRGAPGDEEEGFPRGRGRGRGRDGGGDYEMVAMNGDTGDTGGK